MARRNRKVGSVGPVAEVVAIPPGYEHLWRVLSEAVLQASDGKGIERHSSPGESFEDQQIVQLCEWMGSHQGAVFQAGKKALESTRLEPARAKAELLGAINYLAAAVLIVERQAARWHAAKVSE